MQTVIPLPGDGAMRLTTARYYTPSGRSIQGLGITPDVPVQETREAPPGFGGEHEADYNKILTNQGGTGAQALPPRTDLPPIAKQIPESRPRVSRSSIRRSRMTRTSSCSRRSLVQAMAAQKSATAN